MLGSPVFKEWSELMQAEKAKPAFLHQFAAVFKLSLAGGEEESSLS